MVKTADNVDIAVLLVKTSSFKRLHSRFTLPQKTHTFVAVLIYMLLSFSDSKQMR